jgi:saccharopine dehydrogenase (NAD+, L-lysine forming)
MQKGSNMSAIIGIRREDKNRWERRVSLTPQAVSKLIDSHDLHFIVQPSPIRIFKDKQYIHAGVELNEDLSRADVIFAVKEIPLDLLEENKTYIFFSHVIKGQDYNMPLLQRLLDLNSTLIDYEKICDEAGRRLVFFGLQAGQAGMIESFHALGRRLKWEGYDSPFIGVKPAWQYSDLANAMDEIRELGLTVRAGIDPDLAPMVVGFAGYGNVSRGAQQIFDLFPHEEIAPEDLSTYFERKNPPRDRLVKVVFKEEDMVEPISPGDEFVLQDYYDYPEKYRGRFDKYLPSLSVLINCIYWTEKYPHVITKENARQLWSSGQRTLRVVGDISCDIDGSVEFTYKSTEPDNPCFVFDPITGGFSDGFEGRGIVDMSVDNLPCELSRDASESFSQALSGYALDLANADFSKPLDELELPSELKRAIITHQGKLMPDYRYLEDFLPES